MVPQSGPTSGRSSQANKKGPPLTSNNRFRAGVGSNDFDTTDIPRSASSPRLRDPPSEETRRSQFPVVFLTADKDKQGKYEEENASLQLMRSMKIKKKKTSKKRIQNRSPSQQELELLESMRFSARAGSMNVLR
jgi:hypothetical protein